MQITRESNPDEARFRKGDFLIGTEKTLNLLKIKVNSFRINIILLKTQQSKTFKNQNTSNTIMFQRNHSMISNL